MSKITTHVLDAVLGRPAVGVAIRLEQLTGTSWLAAARSATDDDGRCRDLPDQAAGGVYRLVFDTSSYLALNGRKSIYPEVTITFTCSAEAHYHLPLLLSDNSYTTYRGS
jgi:5-hydroxyisourate hydrolase